MPPSRPVRRGRRDAPWVEQLRSLGADVAVGDSPPLRADAALLSTAAHGADPAALCRQHRDQWPHLPLLLLGRFPSEADRIVALESGADDCLGQECTPRELLARVRALRRRLAAVSEHKRAAAMGPSANDGGSAGPATHAAPVVPVGRWLYSRAQRCLTDRDGVTRYSGLSGVEIGLLDALTATPGRVVDRHALLRQWARKGPSTTLRAVDTAVMRLRRRVEPDPSQPRWILTVRGQGYCYVHADGD